MIEVAKLKSRTVKDLATMAKRKGVPGWHAMRKEELIRALAKYAKLEARRTNLREPKNGKTNGASRPGDSHPPAVNSPEARKKARTLQRLHQIQDRLAQSRDLSHQGKEGNGRVKDRLVVMVRDPYWLHAYWELSRSSVERVRVALGQRWHESRAVLRLSEVTRDGTTSTVRKIVRDIEVHGGVNNWYIDVSDPPRTFQVDIGYLALDGRFLSLARSNVVTTPRCVVGPPVDGNWAEVAHDFDRVFALSGGYSDRGDNTDLKDLFEERLRRPMGSPVVARFGLGASGMGCNHSDFSLEVDAELIVYGVTEPDAHVTLRGEPVKVHPDGTFTMRLNLLDRRQVLPVVASSGDGVEQRTIVLAVERNTKVMEPVIRDGAD